MASYSAVSVTPSQPKEKKKPTLILIRGPIGTGKSTMGTYFKDVHGFVHMETDMYFWKDGVYAFDVSLLDKYHKRCLEEVTNLLKRGKSVVVTNCFKCRWELKPYLELMKHANIQVYYTTDHHVFTPDKPIPQHAIENSYNKIESLAGSKAVHLKIDPETGNRTFCYGERSNAEKNVLRGLKN